MCNHAIINEHIKIIYKNDQTRTDENQIQQSIARNR